MSALLVGLVLLPATLLYLHAPHCQRAALKSYVPRRHRVVLSAYDTAVDLCETVVNGDGSDGSLEGVPSLLSDVFESDFDRILSTSRRDLIANGARPAIRSSTRSISEHLLTSRVRPAAAAALLIPCSHHRSSSHLRASC
jgi:hypothetical protein